MSQKQSSQVRTFQAVEAGDRIDRFLAACCPDVSRSVIQKLIDSHLVLVNKFPVRPSYKLKQGDNVTMEIPPTPPAIIQPQDIAIKVIYADNDLIVIDKQAGLTVYPGPGHSDSTLVNALLQHFPDLSSFGASLRPGIVHRLDKNTSGLIVIARHEQARQYLVEQFKTRSVSKRYMVLVKGRVEPSRGAIDAPIGRDPSHRQRMAVVSSGREARTSYTVKQNFKGFTLLEVSIETGRTHQIRVHFAAIGYPVVGDDVYGVKSAYLKRQFLHAHRLEIRLPGDGQYHVFNSELPDDLKYILQNLEKG